MGKATSGRSKPPSRDRYDKEHPVISIRVSKEEYDRVELKKAEGVTPHQILLSGLGMVEVNATKVEKIKKEAYDRGLDDGKEAGLQQGIDHFSIPFTCKACRKRDYAYTPEQIEALTKYAESRGWLCESCTERMHK